MIYVRDLEIGGKRFAEPLNLARLLGRMRIDRVGQFPQTRGGPRRIVVAISDEPVDDLLARSTVVEVDRVHRNVCLAGDSLQRRPGFATLEFESWPE